MHWEIHILKSLFTVIFSKTDGGLLPTFQGLPDVDRTEEKQVSLPGREAQQAKRLHKPVVQASKPDKHPRQLGGYRPRPTRCCAR